MSLDKTLIGALNLLREHRESIEQTNAMPDGRVHDAEARADVERHEAACAAIRDAISVLQMERSQHDADTRELCSLRTERDAARRQRDNWKAAYDAWQPAGTYVQGLSNAGVLPARMLGMHCGDALVAFVEQLRTELARKEKIRADAVQSTRLQADMIDKLKLRLTRAHDALEEIALAGMSGTGQESPEAMTDWHARRAWEFIGIASRALWPELASAAAPVLEVRACGCSQAKAGRCVMGDYGALPIGTQLYVGAAPERAEPQPRPTCSSSGLLGASSGVGRECDYWAGSVCTSPEPCQHQQPVKPCRTCGPDGCPDSVACPKGGAA